LGLTSACIDKRGSFGGTCLNIGCIPSKALLHASERFHEALHDFAKLGIKAKVDLDLPAMMAQKTKVVGELTRGVEFLLKKGQERGDCRRRRRITAARKGLKVKLPDGKTRS
jgi:dihydrolipoamide dehydrogenase